MPISLKYECEQCGDDEYLHDFKDAANHNRNCPDHYIYATVDEDELRRYMVKHGLFTPAAEDE